MSLLYLDATGNWSDPTSSGLKYLRADGVYAEPSMDFKFFDGNGEYSTPELLPPDLSTPEYIKAVSDYALQDADAAWNKYGGMDTGQIDIGKYGKINFKLVGTQADTGSKGTFGLSFLATDKLNIATQMGDSNKLPKSGVDMGYFYSANVMKEFLWDIEDYFDPAYYSIVGSNVKKSMNYCDKVTNGLIDYSGFRATMHLVDHFWIPSVAELGYDKNGIYPAYPSTLDDWKGNDIYGKTLDGKPYKYFNDVINVDSEKRWLGGDGTTFWTRSLCYSSSSYYRGYICFGIIHKYNSPSYGVASCTQTVNTVIGFCV